MIECEPTASEDVENVAVPLDNVPVPSVVDPSLKVTVPVADEGDTVAVKVTDAPGGGLASDADTDVFVVISVHAADEVEPGGLVPKLQTVGDEAPAVL